MIIIKRIENTKKTTPKSETLEKKEKKDLSFSNSVLPLSHLLK